MPIEYLRTDITPNDALFRALPPLRYSTVPERGGVGGEVAKMINAFGAPIDQADATAIAEYLKSNYGM
jgi:hypothetical protein